MWPGLNHTEVWITFIYLVFENIINVAKNIGSYSCAFRIKVVQMLSELPHKFTLFLTLFWII